MKNLLLVLIVALVWGACQSDTSPKTGEELQRIKSELEAKKKELADKQQIAEIEKELEAVDKQLRAVGKTTPQEVTDPSPTTTPTTAAPQVETNKEPNAKIVGSNVTMRKDATVQSEKLGSFDSNEAVEVLETKNVNNDREAILTKPITVKGSGGEVNLPKGKAVVIEEYQSERNYYLVTYQDPQKGKLTAEIDASAVETITYSTWYRVKRANGETGWVLGKFLKIN